MCLWCISPIDILYISHSADQIVQSLERLNMLFSMHVGLDSHIFSNSICF